MPNRPIRLFRPFRRRLLRRGASWRARSQDGALHTVGPVLRDHQGVSLVIAALLVVATGVVTLALGPAPATADPNLPDVTVHVTTAPMTNLTLHTGVTRTPSCPTGSLVVGGGGYLRNASNPATAPTNGLVLGGTNPSTGAVTCRDDGTTGLPLGRDHLGGHGPCVDRAGGMGWSSTPGGCRPV
jgi:hypothetical protein